VGIERKIKKKVEGRIVSCVENNGRDFVKPGERGGL
jgi:hypothetical protein